MNDCGRIQRGAGTDLSIRELELLIQGMNGEAFSPESLVLPRGIIALCEDQALRTAIMASLPTIDDGGLAVRQLGGDPNRGIRIPGASSESPRRDDSAPGRTSPGPPIQQGQGTGGG